MEYVSSADLQPLENPQRAAQVRTYTLFLMPSSPAMPSPTILPLEAQPRGRTMCSQSAVLDLLQACEAGLTSKVWTDAIAALNTLRQLTVHHPEVIRPSLCVFARSGS